MEYIRATENDTDQITRLVQDTIRTIYRNTIQKRWLTFSVNIIVERILLRI